MPKHLGALVGMAVAVALGCSPGAPPPGMVTKLARPLPSDPSLLELARAEPTRDERALLVVHPRTACSGSASMVLIDEDGRFVGAVPPGAAALLRVPRAAARLRMFSSVELTAATGSWFVASDVDVPAFPSGVLLSAQRWSGLQCGIGHYATAQAATKSELEEVLAEDSMRWLEPDPRAGQAWLDAHAGRVREIRGRPALVEPPWNVPLQARQ